MASVSRALLDDDKVQVVRDVVHGGTRRFTCEQAAALMRLALLDDPRVEIGVLLYPHLTDPDNFHLLTRAFTLPSAANDLRRRVGR